MSDAKPARRVELDFLRGLALIVMAVGHPIRANIYEGPIDIDPVRLVMNRYGELFSCLFMFISGINVQNFLASAAKNPGFDATGFYVKSAVALFVLGWTYNLQVQTALFMDIIQCMALGTLVAYLMLRFRVPTWAMVLFVAALFVAALALVGPGPVTNETMQRVRPYRYWIAMFGPIPWLAYYVYGLVIDRVSSGRGKDVLLYGGIAVFALGHALPELRGTEPAVHLLKVNARFVVMSLGLLPAALIACQRLYRGRSSIGRAIEFWGVESLVFLVFHWIWIFYLFYPQLRVQKIAGEGAAVWFTGLLTLAIMAATVRPIAGLRDRWLRSPNFGRRAWTVLGIAMLGWLLATGRVAGLAAKRHLGMEDLAVTSPSLDPIYVAYVVRQNFAFLAAAAFCFLYPWIRARFRASSMRGTARA